MKKVLVLILTVCSLCGLTGCYTYEDNLSYLRVDTENGGKVFPTFTTMKDAINNPVKLEVDKNSGYTATFKCSDCGTEKTVKNVKSAAFECKCPKEKKDGKKRKYVVLEVRKTTKKTNKKS